MRSHSLFLFLGLSALSVYACNPPDRTFDPGDAAGGSKSEDGTGGRVLNGDGDGDGSGGEIVPGDGDGDGPGGGNGDGGGDGEGTGGNISVEPCGDGQQSSEEACDDGNTDDDDGCSSTCEVEEGWFCPAADTSCLDCRGDYPIAGCPCTEQDELACAGAHQAARLKCDGTLWGGLADCDGGTLCDGETGDCLTVIPQCENTSDGYQFCGANNVRHTCGPDWVTTEEVACAGVCQDGGCNAPDCGDGVLQAETEDCDDGNLNNGDGCDDQCTRTSGWYCPQVNAACLNCSGGPKVGCPCVDTNYPSGGHLAGEDACNGAAQKVTLECSTSTQLWIAGPLCTATQNCEQETGLCKNIVSGCSGKTEGFAFCATGDVRHVCDEDLVNTEQTTCQGVCSGGVCQSPRCGDGKIQSGEACDDGDNTAANGCEPASSSAPCQESGVVKVEAGRDFSCALLVGGSVRCWGNNAKGQLGTGNTTFYGNKHPREIPLVALTEPAKSIAAKGSMACAVLNSGAVACWGENDNGQLGQGSNSPAFNATPQRIDFGTDVDQVDVGGDHACAKLVNGQVRCWGTNSGGELGLNTTSAVSLMTPATSLGVVSLGGNALKVATAAGGSCALLSGGSVRCWGLEISGQMGMGLASGTIIGDNETPGSVGPLVFRDSKVIEDLVAGFIYFCARGQAGPTQCWGANSKGQLGVSSTTNVGTSTLLLSAGGDIQLDTDDQAVMLSADGETTCAITEAETLRCWGSNAYGQAGLADVATYGAAGAEQLWKLSTLFTGELSAVDVGVGQFHTCALSQNGEVRCWGRNGDNQLGLGYVSSGAKDYVGKTAAELPSLLPALEVFP